MSEEDKKNSEQSNEQELNMDSEIIGEEEKNLEAEKVVSKGKRNVNVTFLVAPLLIVSLMFLGLFIVLNSNSKMRFIDSFSYMQDKLESYTSGFHISSLLDQYTSTVNSKISLKSDLLQQASTEETQPYINLINNIGNMEITENVKCDKAAKKMVTNVIASLKGETLFDLTHFVDQNKQYIYFKNVIDEYIDLGTDVNIFDMMQESKKNAEDYHYIMDVLEDSLKKNIKASYIEKEKATIQLDNKDIKVDKYTLVLNGKNAHELFSNILNDLKKDKKAKEIITKLYPEFDEAVVDIDKNSDGVRYHVYTKSANKIVKIELEADDGTLAFIEEEKDVIEFTDEGKVVFRVEIEKENENLTMEIMDSAKTTLGTITLKIGEEKIEGEVAVNIQGVEINGNLVSTTVKKNDKEYDGTTKFSLDIGSMGMSLFTLTVDSTSNLKEGANITETASNVANANSLTQEEQDQITQTLYSLLAKLMQ